MRAYLAIAAAAAMMTGAALAQPANRDANTPAVNTPKGGHGPAIFSRRPGPAPPRATSPCVRRSFADS